jgi:hypothetical protein
VDPGYAVERRPVAPGPRPGRVAAALLLTAVAVAVAVSVAVSVVIRARARGLAESYRRAALMTPGAPAACARRRSRSPEPVAGPGPAAGPAPAAGAARDLHKLVEFAQAAR